MKFLLFFFLLIASAFSLPARTRRQTYYPSNNWGYQPTFNRSYNRGLWRNGGIGGPNGEGSTWEGANAFGISNNDISIFGAFYKK